MKRYDIVHGGDFEEYADGHFVIYTDHLAEVTRLNAEMGTLRAQVQDLQADRISTDAMIERLRAALQRAVCPTCGCGVGDTGICSNSLHFICSIPDEGLQSK